ncbi:MAG: Fe2+-enterobactin ABC transporter substrate-binding protein, partial [Microbacterium gubbeenense]
PTSEAPDAAGHTQPAPRPDCVSADSAHHPALRAHPPFYLPADDQAAEEGFGSDEVLANVPSVANGQVYGLGANSFRVDKFSATEIVEHIADVFAE